MFFNDIAGFRCSRQLYRDFKKAIKKNPEIDGFSHGVRVAMMRYIRELNDPKFKF